jgi:eukaryotic-like serine/threonine-protein kinase
VTDRDDDDESDTSSTDALLRDVARAEPRTPPGTETLVGRELGHFRIDAMLGAGGMGIVYRATDQKLRREVAIKVLPESLTRDEERRRRLLREARSAAAITHPNLATIHEVDEADGRIYVVMELVVGESLRERLRAGRLEDQETKRVAREIAKGLQRAHEKGIVHRDLKPDNVMLASDGAVKILDFGLAKVREAEADAGEPELAMQMTATATEEGRVVGTPAYMSPEQAAGKSVGARSDLFSLGVVIYEMTTGVRPFTGETTAEILAAVLRDEPARPSTHRTGLDPALERVIDRCLRKAKEERYASAEELLAALDGVGSAAPARRAAKPWGAIAAIAALTVAVGVVGARSNVLPKDTPHALASASASVSAPHVTTLGNLPPPATKNPEAAEQYAAGMQALHNDNWGLAETRFEHAILLDPGLAEAHMRIAMANIALMNPEKKRAAYAKAAALRTQLTSRDRALFEALEPVLQFTVPNAVEGIKRLDTLATRDPFDAEVYMWLGMLRYGHPDSLAPAIRATELDPHDGQSWETQGWAKLVLGRTAEARADFERAAGIAVDAGDPYLWLGLTDWYEGRCADFERNERVAKDRGEFTGYYFLMWAQGSLDRSPDTLRDTLGQSFEVVPSQRALYTAALESQLALVAGDFTRAQGLIEKEAVALAADAGARAVYQPHLALTMRTVMMRLEIGDVAGARDAASAFTSRASSWTREDAMTHGIDPSFYLTRIARGAPDGLEGARNAWVDERLALGAYRGHVWSFAYAAAALSPAEARAALAALPDYAPLSPISMCMSFPILDGGIPDAEAGRVYLLADRVDEAIPYLKRAVASCGSFVSPFTHVHAALDLGRALEAKSDKPGACDAYGKVLARFGKAKPRSVSAEAARARRKALGCEG